MAGKHGKRCYYQILLQPNRAALIEAIAQARSTPDKTVRSTELIREFVYESLERELPRAEYAEAVKADEEVWEQAVRNRVAGRAARRKQAEEEFKARNENVPE